MLTTLALRGVKLQRNLTRFAVITGTLVPAATLMVLAAIYLIQGKHVQIDFDAAGLVPDVVLGGPARGLMIAARDGNLPPSMQRENAFGMPTVIILCQAVVNGALAFLFALTPSIQDAWWALLIAQTQLTLILYVILFFTVIRLRRLHPDRPRPFRIPGGKVGLYGVTGVGIVCCSTVICLGFIPPDELDVALPGYVAAMAGAVGFVIALPFIIGRFRKPSWGASPPPGRPGDPEPEPVG